jgi:hypothetical protein
MRKFSQSLPDSAAAGPEVTETKSATTPAAMEIFVSQFTARLDLTAHPMTENQEPPTQSQTFLLTGSTGALGCHLLAQLTARDDIQRVYALNRPSSDSVPLLARQVAALEKHGLSPALASSEKLTLLSGNLEREDFGISPEIMEEVRTVTKNKKCSQ